MNATPEYGLAPRLHTSGVSGRLETLDRCLHRLIELPSAPMQSSSRLESFVDGCNNGWGRTVARMARACRPLLRPVPAV